MRVDVTYTFRCTASGCPESGVDHHDHVWTGRLPQPDLPAGWQLVGALVFCPRHTLLLQVDGQTQELEADEDTA